MQARRYENIMKVNFAKATQLSSSYSKACLHTTSAACAKLKMRHWVCCTGAGTCVQTLLPRGTTRMTACTRAPVQVQHKQRRSLAQETCKSTMWPTHPVQMEPLHNPVCWYNIQRIRKNSEGDKERG